MHIVDLLRHAFSESTSTESPFDSHLAAKRIFDRRLPKPRPQRQRTSANPLRMVYLVLLILISGKSSAAQYLIQSTATVRYTPTFVTGPVTNTSVLTLPGDVYTQDNCSLLTTESGGLSTPGYAGVPGQFAKADSVLSLGDGASSSRGQAYALGRISVTNTGNFPLTVGYVGVLDFSLAASKSGIGAVAGSYLVRMSADPYYLSGGQQVHSLTNPIVKELSGSFDFDGTSSRSGSIPFHFSFQVPPASSRIELVNAKLEISHIAAPVPEPSTAAGLILFVTGVIASSLKRHPA